MIWTIGTTSASNIKFNKVQALTTEMAKSITLSILNKISLSIFNQYWYSSKLPYLYFIDLNIFQNFVITICWSQYFQKHSSLTTTQQLWGNMKSFHVEESISFEANTSKNIIKTVESINHEEGTSMVLYSRWRVFTPMSTQAYGGFGVNVCSCKIFSLNCQEYKFISFFGQ